MIASCSLIFYSLLNLELARALRDHVDLPEYKKAVEAVWEFAAERKCPALCHGLLTPEVAKSYPEAVSFLRHTGNSNNVRRGLGDRGQPATFEKKA